MAVLLVSRDAGHLTHAQAVSGQLRGLYNLTKGEGAWVSSAALTCSASNDVQVRAWVQLSSTCLGSHKDMLLRAKEPRAYPHPCSFSTGNSAGSLYGGTCLPGVDHLTLWLLQ